MNLSKVSAWVPAPISSAAARILEVLGIRERYVRGPHGFDVKVGLSTDIAVYYPDNLSKLYQLTQWLPVFENHPDDLSFGLVIRNIHVFNELKDKTSLPIAHVPGFADLMSLYRVSPFKAVIYVNNGVANFQSLTVGELAHVHVNHGESDKVSMVSNQVKAYDRVFVAGEAAVMRHRAALAQFNENVLVRVGRPQLDENPEPSLPSSSRSTILYAPTWAGEDEANNYTSMEKMAPQIIDAMLSQENVRVVYKPHPRIADASDERIRKNHSYVLRAIKAANDSDPSAGHLVREAGDILAIFPRADLLISDISSVALDFLYLRTEAPIILTDRRNNVDQLRIDAPLSVATPVLTTKTIHQATEIIKETLRNDEFGKDRKVLREFYFDNVQAGESAPRFYQAMRDTISEHSADVKRAKSLAETGTGPNFEHRA